MGDVNFWISFTKDFVKTYGSIILHRYYYDVSADVPNTIKKITLNYLTADVLLNMKANQMLWIYP